MAREYRSSLLRTPTFSRIFSLTSSCTSSISPGVIAVTWLKSNRSLSGATSEPACRTWLPSTWRRAA